MLILTNTTDKLQVLTGAAADVDVHVSYTDAPTPITPTSSVTPGRQNTAITTATTTDILAAPAGSVVRNVKTIHIVNKDTADATDVTVIYDQNATDFVLHKTNLAPGEALEYVEGIGWFEIEPEADPVMYVRKTAQQTFSAAAFADITGMGFSLSANRVYELEYDIIWRSATVTVGVGIAVNGPASPVSVQGTVLIVGARAAGAITDLLGAGFAAYDSPAITTLTANATATDYMARMSCLIEVGGTGGTLIARWRSETATATTVEAGSFGTCKLIR
jgi:hypothetical protein